MGNDKDASRALLVSCDSNAALKRSQCSCLRNTYSFSSLAAVLRVLHGGKPTIASEGLDKLYNEVGMTRCLTRFIGTTDALEAFKNDSWAGDWKDPRVKQIAKLQAISMAIYHPMEHVGWAAYIAPKLIRANGDWWFAKACWTWVFYVVADMYITMLKLKELKKRELLLQHELQTADGASEREAVFTGLAQLKQGRRLLHLQLWRDLFYLPNAVHWSFVKPPMPKGYVAALGLAEACSASVLSERKDIESSFDIVQRVHRMGAVPVHSRLVRQASRMRA
eukprot:7600-Heterococcus_DN1.PRE.3